MTTDQDSSRERWASETLEQYLTRLIAMDEGVSPEEVTLEFIRKKREERIYPNERYSICTDYGGYRSGNLEVLTREELSRREKETYEWLKQFSE
jgi:hypothetical protein